MSTNAAPPPAASAPAPPEATAPELSAEQDPAVAKALMDTAKSLATLYMECHKAEPDSPICDAVMQMQRATAEIGRNVGMPGLSADAPMPEGDPMAEGGMPPEEGMPMEGEMPPPEGEMPMGEEIPEQAFEEMPPGASMDDAAGSLHEATMEAARRRQGV